MCALQIAADGVRLEENLKVPLLEAWTNYSKFLIKLIQQVKPNFLKGCKFRTLSQGKIFKIPFGQRIFFCTLSFYSALLNFGCLILIVTIFPDQQFVAIFLEIPSLFKVRTLPKSTLASKSFKCWRPSLVEVRDAVCLHVTVSVNNFRFFYIANQSVPFSFWKQWENSFALKKGTESYSVYFEESKQPFGLLNEFK